MQPRLVSLLAALALSSTAATGAETPIYRTVIADHAAGKITVIDAGKGLAIGHFGVAGPARLKLAPEGRMVTLAQGAQGLVQFLDSGLTISGHGDHSDVDIAGPAKMLTGQIAGPKPSHINFGNKRIAAFFDGEGIARVASLDAISAGKGKTTEVRSARAHHGVAKPVGNMIAISIPHPTDEKALPVGIELVDGDRRNVRSTECPDMHGEGESADTLAFGCGDGILFLRSVKGKHSFSKVAYPVDLPQGQKVRNIEGAAEIKAMLADFGPTGMVVIDPDAATFQHIALPARRMAFAIDKAQGDFGYTITEDGSVQRINVLASKIEKSAPVTDRYSMEGGSAVARPRLAAHGNVVVVTDPAKGVVHILDAKSLTKRHSVAVPGAPFDVVLTGGVAGDH